MHLPRSPAFRSVLAHKLRACTMSCIQHQLAREVYLSCSLILILKVRPRDLRHVSDLNALDEGRMQTSTSITTSLLETWGQKTEDDRRHKSRHTAMVYWTIVSVYISTWTHHTPTDAPMALRLVSVIVFRFLPLSLGKWNSLMSLSQCCVLLGDWCVFVVSQSTICYTFYNGLSSPNIWLQV